MRRLRATALLAGLLLFGLPIGTASAYHDTSHAFAGNWTTYYPQSQSHGSIGFRLVGDAEGLAELERLGGLPCPEPADYYRGTYTTVDDTGIHVGCVPTAPGATHSTIHSRYESPIYEVRGSFENTIGHANPRSWTGRFAEDGPHGGSGSWTGAFAGHIPGDGAGACPGAPVGRAAAAIGEVTVASVTPTAEYLRPGEEPCPVTLATVLRPGDEISVGPGGRVVLQLADEATVTLEAGTELKIASFLVVGPYVATELLLANGRVSADVTGSQGFLSDFHLHSPAVDAAVRGTKLAVEHDKSSEISVTEVTEGLVSVQPLMPHNPYADPPIPRGDPVVLSANQEVQVSATATGMIAPVGQSTPPSAAPPPIIKKAKAIGKVRALLRRNAGVCDLRTRSVKARAIENGWRVTARIRLDGGPLRSAVFTVKGRNGGPKAANGLARRVQRGCP